MVKSMTLGAREVRVRRTLVREGYLLRKTRGYTSYELKYMIITADQGLLMSHWGD